MCKMFHFCHPSPHFHRTSGLSHRSLFQCFPSFLLNKKFTETGNFFLYTAKKVFRFRKLFRLQR